MNSQVHVISLYHTETPSAVIKGPPLPLAAWDIVAFACTRQRFTERLDHDSTTPCCKNVTENKPDETCVYHSNKEKPESSGVLEGFRETTAK